jgi:uracil-DNA glycosylase
LPRERTCPDPTAQGGVVELVAAIRAQIEHQQRLGVSGYPIEARAVVPPSRETQPATRRAPPPARAETAETRSLFTEPGVAGARSLDALRAAIGDCQRCKLASHRTNLVFGVGNPNARLAFVGEGPGADEDAQGEPFVGRAGQLLTEIITKGMRLRREDVYIANVIKCRPPGNRNPEPDEVASCEPFLVRQLELIRPEVVVALGKFAAQTLLRSKTPITQLRGRWFDYRGIRLMPTFHPAYLLRNPGDKRLVWQDIQQVMQVLGLPGARS